MQNREGGMTQVAANEWKAVEKLAVEVALHPETFVGGDEELASKLAHSTQHLFNLGRRWEGRATAPHGGPLNELVLDGFDSEQIWEQLALHHTPLLRHLRRQALNLAKASDKGTQSFFPFIKPEPKKVVQKEPEEKEEEEDEAEEDEAEEGEEDQDESEEEELNGLENGTNGSLATGESEEDDEDELADSTEEGTSIAAEEDGEEDDDEEEEDDDDDDEGETNKTTAKKEKQGANNKKATGDRFFNFDDMERFIDDAELEAEKARDEEEKGGGGSEDEEGLLDDDMDEDQEDEEAELDMEMMGGGSISGGGGLEDDDEDEDGEDGEGAALGGGIKYDQFFDRPEDEEEEEEEDQERRKKKGKKGAGLEETIAALEDKIVGAKPWQLRGEVNNRKRPLNSLLEEHVEFETVVRQAPVITEEVTMALEDIIKRRIVEGSFDDVVRQEEEELARTHKAAPELDFQKSQKSLAELYEDEYVKNVEKASAKPVGVVEEKKTKDQEEVLRRFAHLAYKLDALSNFHFTPKPVIPEMTVKENVAAIRMEEIIPIGVSDASLLAPQEVFTPDKRGSALPTADSASAKKRHRKRKQHTGSKVGNGMPKGKNVKRAEKSLDGAMTSTKLFKQLTQENQTAKTQGGRKGNQQQPPAPKGGRKDTGFKL